MSSNRKPDNSKIITPATKEIMSNISAEERSAIHQWISDSIDTDLCRRMTMPIQEQNKNHLTFPMEKLPFADGVVFFKKYAAIYGLKTGLHGVLEKGIVTSRGIDEVNSRFRTAEADMGKFNPCVVRRALVAAETGFHTLSNQEFQMLSYATEFSQTHEDAYYNWIRPTKESADDSYIRIFESIPAAMQKITYEDFEMLAKEVLQEKALPTEIPKNATHYTPQQWAEYRDYNSLAPTRTI